MSEITVLQSGGVTSPQGFRAATAAAGLKQAGDDLLLLVSDQPAACAALFTTNLVRAAPVEVCAAHAAGPAVRALIANSGNANCCTGQAGYEAARAMCRLAAEVVPCHPQEVLVCSTGIIGVPLATDRIAAAMSRLVWQSDAVQAARAVMTTDTRPKHLAVQAQFGGKTVTLGGQVKGSGMIGPRVAPLRPSAPLHATMLVFLTTDAAVPQDRLQAMLHQVAERTFNAVTIDGDTSTNDTVLLLANGASGVEITAADEARFLAMLDLLCLELARQMAADGEGATRLVTIRVEEAADEAGARQVAMTIANSPLVKTAIFGHDPNWGRIAAAAGRAGVPFNPQAMSIALGGVAIYGAGEPLTCDEAEVRRILGEPELVITVQLGAGSASWTAWTCDFSYDYVRINAEYHT